MSALSSGQEVGLPSKDKNFDSLHPEDNNLLTIGLAQISPGWLDRNRTLDKVKSYLGVVRR
jgi:hypothetical protein